MTNNGCRKHFGIRLFFVFPVLLIMISAIAGTDGVRADVLAGGRGGKMGASGQAETSVLAKGWALFYSRSYPVAYKQAQGLLRSKNEGRRVEAAHLQARAMWAMGTQAQREKANKIWAVLRRASSLNTLQERLKIAEALQLASTDDSSQADKAIGILEDIVSRSYPGTCTAEAAMVLSELYAQREYYVKAKRVLDSATKRIDIRRSFFPTDERAVGVNPHFIRPAY